MKHGDQVEWYCPNCEAENIDIYGETAIPICEECGTEFEWSDILEDFFDTARDG